MLVVSEVFGIPYWQHNYFQSIEFTYTNDGNLFNMYSSVLFFCPTPSQVFMISGISSYGELIAPDSFEEFVI